MNRYLTNVLASLLDEEHRELAVRIDKHLAQLANDLPEHGQILLQEFTRKPGDNAAAEFIVFISLLQAAIEEAKL